MKPNYLLIGVCISMVCCKNNINNNTQNNELYHQENKWQDNVVFEKSIDGDSIFTYTLNNKNGLKATINNFGLRLVSLEVPDGNNNFDDVVLGYNTIDEYLNLKENYFGAVIGRYGNRIAKGKFKLNDQKYSLAVNSGVNHLHGGNKGFESKIWKAKQISNQEIKFTYVSVDMEEGYPGNLTINVIYKLTDDNEFKIDYEAKTDKPTIVNLTNHSYFNLKGEGNGDIKNHIISINADSFTPVDKNLIPTGEISKVDETPLDFRIPKEIGLQIDDNHEQLNFGHGYDHNFVLNKATTNKNKLVLAARVEEPNNGRVMEVFTNEPGIQFYTGNFLGEYKAKNGGKYIKRGAFCLETQHYPDSPNKSNFPSTVLNPNETYNSTCIYKFSTLKVD